MRHRSTTCALLLGLLAPGTWVQPQAQTLVADPGESARVIVKFKADSPLLRKRSLSVAMQHGERAEALGQRIGLGAGRLRAGLGLSERAQVVTASGIGSAALAARLAQESDVEYAVVDQRRKRLSAPNDALYAASVSISPASGQWYLRAPDSVVKSSINAEAAWDITTGSPSIVVADLDTGVVFDHVDLGRVANGGTSGGNLLPGYDFVTSDFIGNDGAAQAGRDSDPSDPGDWVTLADVRSPANIIGCGVSEISNSSWHGTQTAGLIGAVTNNGIGMASVGRNIRVLPVRVLGKCGGFDSDIIAGMRWAAGLPVPNVPDNPNPARVLNMSLGGTGACSAAYVQAIAEINAKGAVVIAAAGNTTGHSVGSPANCSGVIGVGGVRHVGTKVGFSDLGPEIAISAPGGNCVNTAAGTACLYPILTTINAGTTSPLAGGSIYTDSFNVSIGTSFSTPLVSGTVGLMLSAQPSLSPSEVRTILQQTARAFPTTGGDNGDGSVVPVCTAPQFDANGSPVDQSQCYCTISTCGAGMLDAGAAVAASAALLQARITASSPTPTAGQALTFNATTSIIGSGRRIVSYAWSLANGGGIVSGFTSATNAATASVTPSAAGTFSIGLTLTDDRGASASTTLAVTVQAAAVTPTPTPPSTTTDTGGGGGGGGGVGLQWLALLWAAVLSLRHAGRAGRAG